MVATGRGDANRTDVLVAMQQLFYPV